MQPVYRVTSTGRATDECYPYSILVAFPAIVRAQDDEYNGQQRYFEVSVNTIDEAFACAVEAVLHGWDSVTVTDRNGVLIYRNPD